MKKRLLLLSMVSIVALTGCDVSQLKDSDGNQIIVKLGDGTNYTANDLFENYSNTSTGAAQYFNAVYDVLIRAVQPKTNAIVDNVADQIDTFVQNAEDAAKSNGTSTKTELSKALEEKGVESLDELEQIYYLDQQKSTYETDYYDANLNGSLLENYINFYAPYHMRHILVKTSSGTSLYKGTISEDDATNLYDLVRRLSTGKESFGVIAQSTANDGDTSSAAIYGDVGVMSTKTEFVSEFKYSVYLYDALLNSDAKANVEAFDARQTNRTFGTSSTVYAGSELIPVSSEEKDYLKDKINFIDYSVFEDLNKYAKITSNDLSDVTLNGKEEYYPRNIIFNNYLNNHALGFITRGSSAAVASSTRFISMPDIVGEDNAANPANDILCDEVGRPILVARAGSGSGDSGYQGIHFMVIQKSPFVSTNSSASLIDELKTYWDTKTYTTSESIEGIDSYVTFLDSTHSEYKKRAEDLKGYIKSCDSNMNFVIYERLLEQAEERYGKVTLGEGIEELINTYIDASRSNSAYSVKQSYEKSWESYIRLLELQDSVEHLKIAESEIARLYPELA